ncbi:hypothetical protein [Mycolicibacterium peregrinum]|nr:hypothetical protein [Mycolicibacterium peregrinum]
MDRSWVRNTAAGCAIACGAMVVGPGMTGTGVASAHLFGIDIHDLFDHKKKNKKKSGPAAAKLGPQRGGGVKNSGGSLGGPRASSGSKPESKVGTTKTGTTSSATTKTGATTVGAGEAPATAARSGTFAESPQSARVDTTGQAPSAVLSGGTAQAPTAAVTGGTSQAPSAVVSGGGGGGGAAGAPTNGNLGRAPGLAPVPTAPSSRTIVIRSTPPKIPAAPAPAIAAPAAPVAPAPVVAPPAPVIAVPAPAAPPAGVPAAGPSAPTIPVPRSEPPVAQPLSVPAVPESFRLGYADYLRTASTSDLLFAVLPGLAGMLLMTAAGGAVGVRQARAAQTLPSPQIARFLP